MNAKISQMILELVKNGMTVKEAVNKILGAGTFAKIAAEIWESFNK